MHRVEPFGLRPRQVDPPHGANLESLVLDALNDPARELPLHGVRLDDGQRAFRHPAIIAQRELPILMQIGELLHVGFAEIQARRGA